MDIATANVGGGYERVRWSPDGREILIDRPLSPNGGHAVYVAPVNEPNQMRLVAEGSDADWSSDGRIVLVRHSNLYVGRIGSAFRRLTYRGGIQPSWSPRGKWLAFVRKKRLFKIPSAGGKPVRITSLRGESPAWSPDGKQVAFLHNKGDAIEPLYFLYRVRLRGGRPRRIGLDFSEGYYNDGASTSERVYGPDWQARPR